MTSSVYVALPAIEPMQTMAAEGEEVKVSDLVIKLLACQNMNQTDILRVMEENGLQKNSKKDYLLKQR